MRVIVVGHRGLIGSAIAAHARALGAEVIGIDRDNYASRRGTHADILVNANGDPVKRRAETEPLESFRAQVDDLIRYMKTCPTAPGVEEVLIPGEPEAIAERKHESQGITIEEETWRQIHMVAAELGVSIPQG